MLPGSLDAGRTALIPSSRIAATRAADFMAALRHIPHIVSVWFTRIESRRSLSTMSDHILRDIGLSRGDVERELLEPFWRK